jgi:AraC-like DNA-binding protein
MNTTPYAIRSTRSFDDADQYQAAIHGGGNLYAPLGRGSFRAELTNIDVGGVKLQRGVETLSRLSVSGIPPNKIGILTWLGDHPLPVVRGVQIQPGDLMCITPGMQCNHRTFGLNEFVAITLDTEKFAQIAHDITDHELVINEGKVRRPQEHLFAWLRSNIQSAFRVSETTPEVFSSEAATKALEQALLRQMIACLEQDQTRSEGVPGWRRVVLARRLLEMLEANLDRALASHELSRELGISDRALRKLCQEQFGVPPLRFLALRRLHLARRALLRADHRSATVTDIATELGIWEFGRFAVAYKALFGESPSATLRRPRKNDFSNTRFEVGFFAVSQC